jgi:hypothetical protein
MNSFFSELRVMKAHRRHDISDKVWQLLEPRLLGSPGNWRSSGR